MGNKSAVMSRALLDTSVLFAAAYRRDSRHADGLSIVQAVDTGSLPDGVVLDYVLAETVNGLVTHAGHEHAVDFLDRLEENTRFHVETLGRDGFSTAKSLFRQHESLSLVDASVVAYGLATDIAYLYAFDDDFDAVSGITRLNSPTNPYEPD